MNKQQLHDLNGVHEMRGQNAPQKLRSYFVVLMTLFTIGLPYSRKFLLVQIFVYLAKKPTE